VVICLERGADLHTIQLMPLLLTVSCFSKIQIGFIFQVPAHLGSPGQKTVKRVCVCVWQKQQKIHTTMGKNVGLTRLTLAQISLLAENTDMTRFMWP